MFASPRNPHIEVDRHGPVMHIANDEMVMDASLLEPCEGQGIKVPKGIERHINSPYSNRPMQDPFQKRGSVEGCGAQAVGAPHCDRMMRIAKWNAAATVCMIAKSFEYNRRCGLRQSEPFYHVSTPLLPCKHSLAP